MPVVSQYIHNISMVILEWDVQVKYESSRKTLSPLFVYFPFIYILGFMGFLKIFLKVQVCVLQLNEELPFFFFFSFQERELLIEFLDSW